MNGYGMFLICWLLVDMLESQIRLGDGASRVISVAKSAVMVWLIFQI